MPKTTTEMTASLISYSSTMSRVALTDSSALPSNKKTPAHETMEGHQEKTDCRRLLYRHQGHLAGPAYRPGDTGRNMMWSDYLTCCGKLFWHAHQPQHHIWFAVSQKNCLM